MRLDYHEGEELPKRWMAWGKCLSSAKQEEWDFDYFLLRLPFYSWEIDFCIGDCREMQSALLCFNGKWQVIKAYP